jgi:hypothetical protein
MGSQSVYPTVELLLVNLSICEPTGEYALGVFTVGRTMAVVLRREGAHEREDQVDHNRPKSNRENKAYEPSPPMNPATSPISHHSETSLLLVVLYSS